MLKTIIRSSGRKLAQDEVDNSDLAAIVKNFDSSRSKSLNDWLQEHYGVTKRYWCAERENASDLAYAASKDALDKAGIRSKDLDFIILNTVFGDYQQPTTATQLQEMLKMADSSFALEINMPCSGPVYGISLAKTLIESGKYQRGLVVGVDKISVFIDKTDFFMSGLFSDGAGTLVLEASDQEGSASFLDFCLYSEGGQNGVNPSLMIKKGKGVFPPEIGAKIDKDYYLQMQGSAVREFIIKSCSQVWNYFQSKHSLRCDDITAVIPHQASWDNIKDALLQVGFNENQLVNTISLWGNTSSASIYMSYDYFIETHPPNKGDKILLLGMGGGLNWGGIMYEF